MWRVRLAAQKACRYRRKGVTYHNCRSPTEDGVLLEQVPRGPTQVSAFSGERVVLEDAYDTKGKCDRGGQSAAGRDRLTVDIV